MTVQLNSGQISLGTCEPWRAHQQQPGTYTMPRRYASPIISPTDYQAGPIDSGIDIARPPARFDDPVDEPRAAPFYESATREDGSSRGFRHDNDSSSSPSSVNVPGAGVAASCPINKTYLTRTPEPISAGTAQQSHDTTFVAEEGLRTRKRARESHDVDGPGTGSLPCKKRRLRLQLITSRLSLPFSLPATHILNRESEEDTPVISRFVKRAAMASKKAGHQTTLVRKAAILNRIRLNIRQAAASRGHERGWRMTEMGALGHSIQLVTDSTGAMFPGRSGEQVPGPIVPRIWRPHTTSPAAAVGLSTLASLAAEVGKAEDPKMPEAPELPMTAPSQVMEPPEPPPTSIMTPMAGADEDEASFPSPDMDYRYADLSDDDMDDVYADFGVLFGGRAESPEKSREDGFYEEYLDEVDGITWAS